ncbi:MAG: spheroidene monooxygenase [Pseudomonadota bacterium]
MAAAADGAGPDGAGPRGVVAPQPPCPFAGEGGAQASRPAVLRGTPQSRIAHRAPARRTGQQAGAQVVTLTCFRFGGPGARLRQLASMPPVYHALARVPGAAFARMMGTGTGEGFDPAPNTAVWTLLASWDDMAAAAEGVEHAAPWAARCARAEECCTLFLAPLSATGRWGGVEPFEVHPDPDARAAGRPIAVLTRATVRARHLIRFWRKVPAINAQIAAGPGMLFRMGMGEVPLLHQVTFSVWRDAGAMRAFAYGGKGHAAAIAAVRAGDWFAEELYARFAVLGTSGSWQGGAVLREHAPAG